MTFGWDNIRYIFQIPLEWFMRIHDRVFKAFGTNFIVVKEDTDSGGTWIDVDEDAFNKAVGNAGSEVFVTVEGDQEVNGSKTFNADVNVHVDGYEGASTRAEETAGNIVAVDDDDATVGFAQWKFQTDGTNELSVGVQKTVSSSVYDGGFTAQVLANGLAKFATIGEVYLTSVGNTSPTSTNGLVHVSNTTNATIDLLPSTSTNSGGALNFHYAGSVSPTSSLLEDANELLMYSNKDILIQSGTNDTIVLDAGANLAQLSVQPTDSTTSSLAIATVGYVQSEIEDLGGVKTVNSISPDSDGNIDLGAIVHSVNSTSPDSSGNVSINVGVKTVNNTSPDANGNINVSADTSTCLKQSDWMNVNSNYSVCPYYYANLGYTGNLPNAVTNIYSYTGMMSYADLDSYITALGYVKDSALSDYVLSSDLTTTLGDYVLSSDLTTTLADYVLYSDLTTTLADYVLSSDLTTILADYVQDADLGDLAFLDNVTVDGHQSNANGEVSFGLTPSKWVKTDASGHLTTTNDTPIAIDTSHYTPVDASNQKVVVDVTWNGTKLQYKYQNWTFKNGVLVSKSNNFTQDIDTPTMISWS